LAGGFLIGKAVVTIPFAYSLALTGGLVMGVLTFLRPEIGLGFLLLSTLFLPEVAMGEVSMGMTRGSRDIGIRPDDILLVLIMFGWFARLVVRRELITLPKTPINIPILLLSVSIILSTIIGCFLGDVPFTTGLFYSGKRLQYFIVFLMVITNIKTLRSIKISIVLLLIASGFVALWGIGEHLLLPEVRISGPFQRAQAPMLGGFFVLIVFTALALFFYKKSLFYRLLLIGLMFASLYAITFTTSRASYVALYIGLIIFAFLSRKYLLLAVPILLIILTPYIFPQQVLEAIYQIGGVLPGEWRAPGVVAPSWEARIGAWQYAIPLVLKRPFFGYGPGSFALSWFDNTYVIDMVYLGLVGLLLFVWLIIRLAQTSWTLYRQDKDPYLSALAMGYLGGLIGLLIHGIAVPTFWTIRTMVPFWFLTGLVVVGWHLYQEGKVGQVVEEEATEIKVT